MTPHGAVETPAFMPVGTLATVKGSGPHQLREIGAQMVLANTYHLALRPGAEVVADLGGLHRVHGLGRADPHRQRRVSGLQPRRRPAQIDDDRVVFRSHIDGSLLELTPERAVAHSGAAWGRLHHVPGRVPAARCAAGDACAAAVDRTTRWAARCRDAQRRGPIRHCSASCRGGPIADCGNVRRRGCCRSIFPAMRSAGLSVGEAAGRDVSRRSTSPCRMLPADRPRYLMGVGRPIDLIEGGAAGDRPVRLRDADPQRPQRDGLHQPRAGASCGT